MLKSDVKNDEIKTLISSKEGNPFIKFILLGLLSKTATIHSTVIFQSYLIMPAVGGHGGQGVSCFDRVKMGFMMGMCVGMASGAIFGGFNCLRYGLRGRELISTVGKVMVQGGGTFGTFMAIGTGIRC